MKILVAIANYGSRNHHYLERLLSEYRSMSFEVKLVVLSNIPKSLGSDVEVKVGLPTSDPWSLPFAHKSLFAERIDQYDLFIYSEDDTLITERNIEDFIEVNALVPEFNIVGFLRYEIAPDGTKYYSTVHRHYHWDIHSIFKIGQYIFARYTNDHSGCYLLTQKQLKKALASGCYLRDPRKGRYDLLVTAATDPYACCGMKKVICISRLQDFALHHLPDKYCGKIGVEASVVEKEIKELIKIADSNDPRPQFIRTETKLTSPSWNKCYYEPVRKDIISLIPDNIISILSMGCGTGATEATMVDSGVRVVGVPLDEVVAVSARDHGIEVTLPNLDSALKQIEEQYFDLILFIDILHLIEDPVSFIKKVLPFLSYGGSVLLSVPNFRYAGVYRRIFSGDTELKELYKFKDFNRYGVHFITIELVNNWLKKCGLTVSAKCTAIGPSYKKLSQITFGVLDRYLTEKIIILARDAGATNY